MPAEPLIQRVDDTKDKQFTYSITLQRLQDAINQDFYLEALLIEGALVEDRVRSYLYHVGVFDKRESRTPNRSTASALAAMPGAHKNKETGLVRADTLESMLRLIGAIEKWSAKTSMMPMDNPYLAALWQQHRDQLEPAGLRTTLKRLDGWRRYRNEVIHGLLHKHVEAIDAGIIERCEEGLALFRELDEHVRRISHGNAIRIALGLDA